MTIFHERRLPELATPAGYAALIDAYSLKAPIPRTLTAICARHRTLERDGWRLLTPRHAPATTLEGHLTFALKHEGLDLAVLKRLFLATGPAPVEAVVRAKPTGRYARRIWFLYEWLVGERLKQPDLKDYSSRVLPLIDWRPTEAGNVEVLSDTADFYRYFDATPQAEFLYACVRQTVEEDLPKEADYLRRYDAFKERVEALVEMPNRTVDLLFRMLRQNGGKLSGRARSKEFAELTDDEARRIEGAYRETFAAL